MGRQFEHVTPVRCVSRGVSVQGGGLFRQVYTYLPDPEAHPSGPRETPCIVPEADASKTPEENTTPPHPEADNPYVDIMTDTRL